MKGIILAGGAGTRLYPITKLYSKQLTIIYDKPLIYYPLSILMLAHIKDILIISNEETIPLYQKLFEDGSQYGLNIQYAIQNAPNGIAEAFIIGEKFIGNDSVSLILGDNIFYGKLNFIYNAVQNHKESGIVFGYPVSDPERYGVVEFDKEGKVISIEEKPKVPKSNYAVPGFYVYDNEVVNISKNLEPSARGELEITDVNKKYLEKGKLRVELIGRGVAWLDTGTPESLLEASMFFQTIEKRQGMKVACIEEIALKQNFITLEQFKSLLEKMPKSYYKEYLEKIIKMEY
ncbi:MAG TPA: glucose-1-phosphate thymidylyltransferase RfbA [Ignavibacteriales bacterium]|nr:glucose-1-phosphate thymidylyltransferase RfbA [Ignavibacteriales bacterium]HPD68082.1 glucose-1-phosphate thymidylyltransferase RfbA [Ignavibacteriales bacterium]HPP32613.1 glucose-1-phosphate thymidylyltransferase RfbA [Ignavibacteriales bacterium]